MFSFIIKRVNRFIKLDLVTLGHLQAKQEGFKIKKVKSLKKNIFINLQQFYINTGDMLAEGEHEQKYP